MHGTIDPLPRSAGPQRIARGAAIGASVAVVSLALLTAWLGLRATLGQVERGLPALPAALAVSLLSLTAAGFAWGAVLPVPVSAWALVRARWLREAVNSILPVASLGGSVVGARLLAREKGVSVATAAASAAADITGEAIAQAGFVTTGLLLASTLPHAPFRPVWVAASALGMVAGLVGAQALGVIGWLERVLVRLLPRRIGEALRGLEAKLHGIYREKRRLAANIGFNFLSWSIGTIEVWVLLRALGHGVPWRAAYAIEGLGLVARSLGFALPAGLGAQETGFVLAGALFGVPHEAGLALSLLKRLRELILGAAGVLYWQFLEWRVGV